MSKRLQAGDNEFQIAKDLERNASTIVREIERNKDLITGLYSGLSGR